MFPKGAATRFTTVTGPGRKAKKQKPVSAFSRHPRPQAAGDQVHEPWRMRFYPLPWWPLAEDKPCILRVTCGD